MVNSEVIHHKKSNCETKVKVEADGYDQWLKESSTLSQLPVTASIKVENIKQKEDEEDTYSTHSGYYDDLDSSSEDEHCNNPLVDQEPKDYEEHKPKNQRRQVNISSLVQCLDTKKVTKMALVKMCKHAEVTDLVGSQCRYDCLENGCNRSFRSWGSLNHHLRADLTHGPADKIEKHLTHPICHKCQICGEKILADRGFLNIHMHNKHKLRLDKYCKKYKKKEGGRYMTKQDSMKDILSKCTMSENEVGKMCVFRCIKCMAPFDSWTNLNDHLITFGHGPRGMENIGKYIVKYVSHRCKLCSKIILNDYINVLSHLRTHKIISIKAYCDRTGTQLYDGMAKLQDYLNKAAKTAPFSKLLDNYCMYKCKTCGEIHKCWSMYRKHLLTTSHGEKQGLSPGNTLPDEEMLAHVTKLVLHKCFLCSKIVPCESHFLNKHLKQFHNGKTNAEYKHELKLWYHEEVIKNIPSSESPMNPLNPQPRGSGVTVTSHLGDFCRFSCPMCPMYTISEWATFKTEHLTVIHGLVDYKPEYCLEARYYDCPLCHSAILSDRYFIEKHLRKKHKQHTVASYCQLAIDRGFSVLFCRRVYLKPSHTRNLS